MPRPRRLFVLYGVLAVIFVAGSAALIVAAGSRQTSVNGRVLASSMAGVNVVNEAGAVRPLVPPGGGTVLVVSSRCIHCHTLLQRMARVAGARGLPSLRVLTLEGTSAGRRMLDSLGMAAEVVGPAESAHSFVRRVGIGGTPTLFQVDARGNVRERAVGVLSERRVREWVERVRSAPAGR